MSTDRLGARRTRRHLLGRLAALAASASLPGLRSAAAATPASRETVVVLTAYPEEVSARIEAAFERAQSRWRVQFVWRMPHDALPLLSGGDQGGVDVYWSASPRTFAALARAGAWRALDIDRAGLPERVGATRLADPQGQYLATEVAGYGWVYDPQRLAALGLAAPQDWDDLAAPGWAGQIALPIPARVGYAPVLVDIVLQAWGWERGWALWSAIAGQARLVGSGSTFITDEVGQGRAALGLTIDFFAAAAIAGGVPLRFAYPRHGGLNPAHVAITRSTAHLDGARAFAQFVLSDAGQRVLLLPTIRKLPVRPAVYAGQPPEQFNPFAAAAQGGYDYDGSSSQDRLSLIAALFEQTLVAEHALRAPLWQAVQAHEASGLPARQAAARQARAALERVPLTEAQAGDAALRARFRRVEGAAPGAASEVELAWRQQAAQWRQEAASALAALNA